uniref:Cyclin N-terminal domain-containing protein n=1 Tax=Steinernema glaseri TaxID=37863 RepID=A0A1I8A763_9BILA
MAETYRRSQWTWLTTIILRFFNSEYSDLVDKETMYFQFISRFERRIKPFHFARICVHVARYITRGRRCTLKGVAAGWTFLKERMELCKHSKEASLMLEVAWLEMCADGDHGFSPELLQVIFDHIKALRRLVDALPRSNMKITVSTILHRVSASIACTSERYDIAYRHISSYCESLPRFLSSASEDHRKRVNQCWAKKLAISALFAEDITDFEPVLVHPVMDPSISTFLILSVLIIFTKCDVVNFYKFKKRCASILPLVLETSSISPHFTPDFFKRNMHFLDAKFCSMAGEKIAANCKMLPAQVDIHVKKFMKNAETYVDQMQGDIIIDWEGILSLESAIAREAKEKLVERDTGLH